ncbi:hypothetical protein [Picosynechococcus sp. PCC 8807]|uniref:hypothetical protein n=1 Tax=Picosynechococcus sp. PCC 8807 TaxID=195248 RepID=UPI00081059E1|nr:hypothetical protein [Picosynechococcus sp. PCC 8807]ANV90777.1 hypothetical protein AWQ24_09110 [Picosynechococcus sp. PCC 8807]
MASISNTVIESFLGIGGAYRAQFTTSPGGLLIRLNSGAGIVQEMGGETVATYPYSRIELYPLIEIAGTVTSVGQFQTTIKTARGIVSLLPLIADFGLSALWGVDCFAPGSNFDLLCLGYVP